MIVSENDVESRCEVADMPIGCVSGQKIYLSQALEQDRLQDTAVHEMLHIAYSRLSSSERQEIQELLQSYKKRQFNRAVSEELALYDDEPDAIYFDEFHSIVGSLDKSVSGPLKEHYQNYINY